MACCTPPENRPRAAEDSISPCCAACTSGDPPRSAVLLGKAALGSDALNVSSAFALPHANSVRFAAVARRYTGLTSASVAVEFSNDLSNWKLGTNRIGFTASGFKTAEETGVGYAWFRFRYSTSGSGSILVNAMFRRYHR
jgi:hypothetical protein